MRNLIFSLLLITTCVNIEPFVSSGEFGNGANSGDDHAEKEIVLDDLLPESHDQNKEVVSSLEKCDGIDNDNNGETDEPDALGCLNFYLDMDQDGFGVNDNFRCLCKPIHLYTATNGDDCNDSDLMINPNANERCNGIDDDCDGVTDEGLIDTGTECIMGEGSCSAIGYTVCTSDGKGRVCNITGAPAGTPCDDNLNCTYDDHCSGGQPQSTCVGTPYQCPEIQCADLECDGKGGCIAKNVKEGCAIDNICYKDKAINPQNPCLICDAAQSNTEWSKMPDGTLCNADDNPCTVGDTCKDGECQPGTIPFGCLDQKPWTEDICTPSNPVTYSCSHKVSESSCKSYGQWVISGGDFDPNLSSISAEAIQNVNQETACSTKCGIVKIQTHYLSYKFQVVPNQKYVAVAKIFDVACKQGFLSFSFQVTDEKNQALVQPVMPQWKDGTNLWKFVITSSFISNSETVILQITLQSDCCGCKQSCDGCVGNLGLIVDNVRVVAQDCWEILGIKG